MNRQQEPTEQLLTQEDFGGIYKSRNSPQQNNNQTVNVSGAVAVAISMLAFGGVLVGAILIPDIIEARANEAAATAKVKADVAERESRIAIDQVQTMRIELAKQKIFIQLDDHQ